MAPKNFLHKCKSSEYSDSETIKILKGTSTVEFEKVTFGSSPIAIGAFSAIGPSDLLSIGTPQSETKYAKELYDALLPVMGTEPNLLSDPGIWAWISLVPMRGYMLARWFEGRDSSNADLPAETKCDYFYTNRNNLKRHTRCGPRRLYIAASACMKADGDLGNLEKFFKSTDLYTGIFERRLGLDSEIAVELALALSDKERAHARYVLRSVELMLSTVALEYLDRGQKKKLISDAIADAP